MSKSCCAASTSNDADRMGKLARPGGQEGNMDHGQGAGTRSGALSAAVSAVKTQVARGSSAPTVGGRKMTDY
jgi:hypothetical protein